MALPKLRCYETGCTWKGTSGVAHAMHRRNFHPPVLAEGTRGTTLAVGTLHHFYANEPIGTVRLSEDDGLWRVEVWSAKSGGRDIEVHTTRESAEAAFSLHTTRY